MKKTLSVYIAKEIEVLQISIEHSQGIIKAEMDYILKTKDYIKRLEGED